MDERLLFRFGFRGNRAELNLSDLTRSAAFVKDGRD
jgi:hypothetical protein